MKISYSKLCAVLGTIFLVYSILNTLAPKERVLELFETKSLLPSGEEVEYCIRENGSTFIYLLKGGYKSSEKTINELKIIPGYEGLCSPNGSSAVNIFHRTEYRCNCTLSKFGCVYTISGEVFKVSSDKKSTFRKCVGECAIGAD